MLCNVCQSIFQESLQFDDSPTIRRWIATFRHPRPLSEIRLSIEQSKCYICIAVLKQWHKLSLDSDENGDDLQLAYTLQVPEEVSRTQLYVQLDLKGRNVGSVNFFLVGLQAEDGVQPSPITSVNTGSAETLDFIKARMKECNERHPQCRNARQGTNWYPTRLVDIGIAGNAPDKDAVKLVITAETPPSGPYASLSHCWGKSEITRLEQENLESMKERIFLRELPKTFQDAVVVCRALNIRYIWIDSLCIIQDRKDDWQREARRMFDVYTNASVNIAATSAADGQAGLFRERDIQALGAEPLHFKEGILKGERRLLDQHYWSESIDGAVLNTRAWVVQERHLSSRIVHFGADQVFWDCSSLAACEFYPSGLVHWSPDWERTRINSQQSWALARTPQSDEQALSQWSRIVGLYSVSHLTFKKDRLIALSGIVEYLQRVLRTEFCAGLWRSKVEVQLAWYTDKGASERKRSYPLRAPTWSWLSVNAPVNYVKIDEYRGYDIVEKATVTEVKLEYNTPDEETGEVVIGYLRMRCILTLVKLCGNDREVRFLEPGLGGLELFSFLDTTVEAGEDETLYFIPLFDVQYDFWGKPPRKASETRGILTKQAGNYRGTYERVGHAHVFGQYSGEDFSPAYVAIRTAKGKETLPCEEYDASLGHLIKLV